MDVVVYTCCIFLMALALAAADVDYCKQKDCGRRHTMCKFPTSKVGKKCGEVEFIGLTREEGGAILKMHNTFRRKVAKGMERRGSPGPQPAARNLKPLRWDKELALIAQRWAIQCKLKKDDCRHVNRFHVQQNMAHSKTAGSGIGIQVTDMVQNWYSAVKFFNKNEVDRLTNFNTWKGQSVKDYIIMMSDKIKSIGCGAIRYKRGRNHNMLLVCNYGPVYTLLGRPLYERL